MKTRFGSVVFAVAVLFAAGASGAARKDLPPSLARLPVQFIENRGQIDSRVSYYVEGRDTAVYFTAEGVTFAFREPEPEGAIPAIRRARLAGPAPGRWVVKLDFVGANAVRPEGRERSEAVVSYFKGVRRDWKTALPTFGSIVYRDLWPGIDLVYSGDVDQLKYSLVVAPGADPRRARFTVRGADRVGINKAGQLEMVTPLRVQRDDAPVSFQETRDGRRDIASRFRLSGSTFGFSVGDYDRSVPLIIDPATIVYAGYVGGSQTDTPYDIAVDSAGNAYIAGYTYSYDFPAVTGPDLNHNGNYTDAFVAKIRADGTGLDYAGYIGSTGFDEAYGVAVDAGGSAYVVGTTTGAPVFGFPVAVGPDLVKHGNGNDGFIAKVNSAGTGLDYCGYVAGLGTIDIAYDVAVDAAGAAYVVGQTNSSHGGSLPLPVSSGPDLTYNGGNDAFVAKVNPSGTSFSYLGYIGGSGDEYATGVAVDGLGRAHVVGATGSDQTTFPVVTGPDVVHNGSWDVFIARVSASGSSLEYSGYIGGTSFDGGGKVAVDAAGNAYVAADTYSTELDGFPVTGGPDLTHNGNSDAFLCKVSDDGTAIVFATYLGGALDEYSGGVAVDGDGNIHLAGTTYSDESTFPVTDGPDLTANGEADTFVAAVKPDASGLLYAGFIGGSDDDYGNGLALDSAGNAYIAGGTSSDETTFPVAVGPDLTYNGYDAFVAKISLGGGFEDDDGDGIANDIDVDPDTPGTGFSDAGQGGATIGDLVLPLPANTEVKIEDDATGGVKVTVTATGAVPGSARVVIQLSGKKSQIRLAVPGEYIVTDPVTDTTVEVTQDGPAEIVITLNGSTIVVSIEEGSSATLTETTNGAGTLTNVVVSDVEGTGVTVNGQPVDPDEQLALLQAKLSIAKGNFNFSGTFTPPSGNGVYPLTEDVTLTVGPYVFEIPAGGFTVASDGSYSHKGTHGGVTLSMQLKPVKGGKWSTNATGRSVSGVPNPANVAVSIGDDGAVASVGYTTK